MNSEMCKSEFVFVCSLLNFTSTRVSLLCHYQFFSPYFPLQCCFAWIVIHVEDEEDGSSTGGVIHWNTSPGCSVYVFFLDVWLHVELIYAWSVLLFPPANSLAATTSNQNALGSMEDILHLVWRSSTVLLSGRYSRI